MACRNKLLGIRQKLIFAIFVCIAEQFNILRIISKQAFSRSKVEGEREALGVLSFSLVSFLKMLLAVRSAR